MPLQEQPKFTLEPIIILDFRTGGDQFSITLTLDDTYEITDSEIIIHYADTPQLKNRVWRQNRARLDGYGTASAMRRVPIPAFTPGQGSPADTPTPAPDGLVDHATPTSSASPASPSRPRRTRSPRQAS